MFEDWTLLAVLAILFVATVIRSAFGFGEALVAVPLLALVIPVEAAAPLAVLVSITVAVVIIIHDWHQVHFRAAGWLVLSSLFGIPIGLWILAAIAAPIVKTILALVIIAFAVYSLVSRTPFELKNDQLAWLFGFFAGVLGGAYGMNGPPLVIYATLRRWSPEYFRATLQGYFLPASAIGMAGYWLAGLWTWTVTEYYVVSLPVALGAIFVGRYIHHRIKDRRFIAYVHIGLIAVALMLLVQAMWKHLEA